MAAIRLDDDRRRLGQPHQRRPLVGSLRRQFRDNLIYQSHEVDRRERQRGRPRKKHQIGDQFVRRKA